MSLLKEYGIKEDKRFIQARKESIRIFIFVLLEFVWVYSFGYWGTTVEPQDYTYVMGFPSWLFWAFLGAGIIFPIVAIILSLLTKDCSLQDYEPSK